MKRTAIAAAAFVLASVLSACGGNDQSAVRQGEKLKVVATIGMIADVAANIGGERVTVEGLMGPGVDPHLYKASEGDVMRLYRANLILYNGLHLEARMGEVLERMGSTHHSAAVTDSLGPDVLLPSASYEGQYDPHVWFDVSLWMEAARRIAAAMATADPPGAEYYRANERAYLARLAELEQYVHEQVARVPEDKRVLVTAHDAFGYFGKAYGFEVHGLQGISTASEAGTGDVQRLAGFIAERRIPAIFVETSIPERNIRAVQAAVRSRGFETAIGGELYSDAMGSKGSGAGTYIGMVRHNVDTIVASMLGEEVAE